jgi:hypothetical protein
LSVFPVSFVVPVHHGHAPLVEQVSGKTLNADVHAERHVHEHAPVSHGNAFPWKIQAQGVAGNRIHIPGERKFDGIGILVE